MTHRNPYRLALDLGTNSLGWCLLDLDSQGRPVAIRRMGVRIFPDGRDPQSQESLAADRRLARSMRRRRDRFVRRRTKLLATLTACGLMPADRAERKALEALDPYELRARALNAALTPHELGRALFHLHQRRGFKSNRKAGGDPNEAGKVKAGISALKAQLTESGAPTVGAWLAERHKDRLPVRSRLSGAGAKATYSFYPERALVEDEFRAIREAQAPHHPALAAADWERIETTIFRQRPLRPVRPGKCTLYPEEERAPWALPVAQRFRILTELHNLRFAKMGEPDRGLPPEERARLYADLCASGDLTFDKLRKRLKLTPEWSIKLEDAKRDRLKGDLTAAALAHKKRFGSVWRTLPDDWQREIVSKLLDTEDETELAAWLQSACELNADAAAFIAEKPGLPDGYCRLSEKALNQIVPLMREGGLPYDKAVLELDKHHSDFRPGELLPELPYYGGPLDRYIAFGTGEPGDPEEKRLGRFPNPTVHIALNELRKLVNQLIRRWGKPQDIVIELARDLKRSQDERDKAQKEQADNQRKNEARAAKIRELGLEPKGEALLRMRLWEELPQQGVARVCVYSGEVIGLTRLLQDDVEIDHILPFSRTLSDGADNKIVCVRDANRSKRNRAPYEAWGVAPVPGFDWNEILERAKALPKNKRWRFQADAMDRFNSESGFLDRQLVETRYLSRVARLYLGSIVPLEKVRAAPGKLTAMLRRRWGLNGILSDSNLKNRCDHRHHAIDAAVLGVIDQRLVQLVALAAQRAEDKELDRLFDGLPDPFDGVSVQSFGDQVRDKVRGIVVSHRMEHGWQGRMHNDTAYGPIAPRGDVWEVVTRKPLESLQSKKDLAAIRDRRLAEALEIHIEEGMDAGKTFAESLKGFVWGNPVRRLRVTETLGNPIAIRDRAGHIYKFYKGDSNAWYDIYRDAKGRWTGRIVTTFEAYALHRDWLKETGGGEDGRLFLDWATRKTAEGRGTPLFRLFKGDMLALGTQPNRAIVRVVKFSEGVIVLADHLQSGNLKARHSDPDDPFRYLMMSPDRLRKEQGRPVGVDPLGYVHDRGPLE